MSDRQRNRARRREAARTGRSWWPDRRWKIRLRDIGADTVEVATQHNDCPFCDSIGEIEAGRYPFALTSRKREAHACTMCGGSGRFLSRGIASVERPQSKYKVRALMKRIGMSGAV